MFWILRDDAFRLAWYKLDPVVVLCVAMLNFRHSYRGFALTDSPPGFQRTVPTPVPSSNIPVGAPRRGLAAPPRHPPDARIGLTPGRAYEILRGQRVEEVQLLLDAFEILDPEGQDMADDALREAE